MEFEPCDRAVYLPAADALVCADLHVGRAATSNVEWGLGEHAHATLLERFETLLERFAPSQTILAGDVLHAFESLPRGAAETVRELQRVAEAAETRLLATPGNHDTMLEELWDGPTAEEYRLGVVVVTHGHERPETDADCYVVGHDHPTIEIEGQRRPCYLYGPEQYGGADVLMLPSFSQLPAGVAVNGMTAREFQSPLVTDADGLRPVVRDEDADETHEFPPLGTFRRML